MLFKKGKMAIGTIIIVVALLLLGAVVVGVHLTLGQGLMNKNNVVRTEVLQTLNAPPNILQITGSDGSNGSIQNLSMYIRSGSGSVDLELLSIQVHTRNMSQTLIYNENSFSRTTFRANYLVNATQRVDGAISRGDLVELEFSPPHDLQSGDRFEVQVRPPGQEYMKEVVKVPEAVSRETVHLFP